MENGVLLSGVLLGVESRTGKDGTTSTSASVAVGMESYRVKLLGEEVSKVYGIPLYTQVVFRARPFCSNNRLYWGDGAVVASADEGES